MQVDESSALSIANGSMKQVCTVCPSGLQQSQTCNAEMSQVKEHSEEKVVVPFNECPSGNEASQLSTDSFCEQVYLDLQQQLEDDPKGKQAIGRLRPSQNILLKLPLTESLPQKKVLATYVDSRPRSPLLNLPRNEVMALAIVL